MVYSHSVEVNSTTALSKAICLEFVYERVQCRAGIYFSKLLKMLFGHFLESIFPKGLRAHYLLVIMTDRMGLGTMASWVYP